jgi:hypothetical protein
MKTIWNRILNEPALLLTALAAGYAAAIAARWVPSQTLAIIIAFALAVGGVLVRENVKPTRTLDATSLSDSRDTGQPLSLAQRRRLEKEDKQ